MKTLKEFINESRSISPNYVVASFPVGKMKRAIDKEWGCDLEIEEGEDLISFSDEEANIFFEIERIQQKIVCSEAIKDFLKEKLHFKDDDFVN